MILLLYVFVGDSTALAFSIGYLTVLFAALIVEHAFGAYWAVPGVNG